MDVQGYPACGPGKNYRGTMTSVGVASLGVRSTNRGSARPGSTLTFTASPLAKTAAAVIVLGFRRNLQFFSVQGAPTILLIPTFDVLLFPKKSGSVASVALTLPPVRGLRGFRFYAQAVIIDAAAKSGGATSNFFMITVE